MFNGNNKFQGIRKKLTEDRGNLLETFYKSVNTLIYAQYNYVQEPNN